MRIGGKTEAPILSFSNVYQGAAQLLKNAQHALGNFEEQLSGDDNFQQQAGSLSDGVGEPPSWAARRPGGRESQIIMIWME